MEDVLLSVHVLAAIVFVGGSAVATSLFPRYAPVATGVPVGVTAEGSQTGSSASKERNLSVAVALHRITRGYGLVGIIVPGAGMVLASAQGRMGEIWIVISMILTVVAAALLSLRIAPRQREALDQPDDGTRLRALAVHAGIYNLLWAAVVILMIVRPGSATGE